MTSIIKVTAISGAMDESPPCYILQVDDARILLDCGWNEHFDQNFIAELSKNVKYIDVVLLSYPDPAHLGALPYLVGKCGLSCPIFATIPVYKMGQMFMYDLYQSRFNNENFSVFNLDDVDAAFDKITQLKYNQTVTLKGKCHGISIVPMPAGHMIGGSIWKIMKVGGGEDIVYAVDFNHKKERHLNGCHFEKIQRPSLLITNASHAVRFQESRRVRDEKLMTTILQTLSKNGNVLIAVDTAGRVLELAHMLDQLWGNKNSGLKNHALCFLNNVSYNVIEFAKSQVEWMSDKLLKTFESARYNPFQFKYIRSCHNIADIMKISTNKVVLASMPDIECGYARNLCIEWITDPRNSIILTSRSSNGTLGRELIDIVTGKKSGTHLRVTVKRREKLSGEELNNYRVQQKYSSDFDSSDSDDIQFSGNIQNKHDFVVKSEEKKSKKNKKYSISRSYPIYPFEEVKKKYDEYGEIIVLSDYIKEAKVPVKTEEKVEEDATDLVDHPTKCVTYEKDLEIKATVQFISFEGRSDGESVQKLITGIHPHSVVLVGSTAEATKSLAHSLRRNLGGINIFLPLIGETVDATTETHIYQIRLTDGLVSSLDMQQGDHVRLEFAWVDAEAVEPSRNYNAVPINNDLSMEISDEVPVDVGEPNSITFDESNNDQLVLDRPPNCSEINPHRTIFVNEIKFALLKQVLMKTGVDCEFIGGVLFCSKKTIAIRRENKRKIYMHGLLSEDYYKVRSALYSLFAIL